MELIWQARVRHPNELELEAVRVHAQMIEHERNVVGTRKRLRDADNGRQGSFGWTVPSRWSPNPLSWLLLLEWRQRDGLEERHMTMMLPVIVTRQSALSGPCISTLGVLG